jgi:Zn-dependent protease with chaperone function
MDAVYYDGTAAIAHRVTLALEGDTIVIGERGPDDSLAADGAWRIVRRDPLGAVEITEAIGRTPRVLRFVGGASCEVADIDAFAALLASAGFADSRVAGWERNLRIVIGAVVMIAVLAVTAYWFGLPVLAKATAERLPESALDTMSKQIQPVLERTMFKPTQLSGQHHAALLNAFDALKVPTGTKARLQPAFYSSPAVGPNAMALPSGRIFVTDELVELMADDRLVMAVICHEAGHVNMRHGVRQIIQSTVMGALVTWYIGDVSALGAAAPTALLQAKYSRDLEREADAYAADMLRLNGMPVSLLADALDKLQEGHGSKGDGGVLAYLSSHPTTPERLAWLRAPGR